ncbi:hypothetical protein [Pantoea ananatis]|uniref:hypothetical protein n=1 Tax=Pantoea ananas TaxID=553 RepID=UPI0021E7B834|nr:hypothetical protein [Pantoea ananatis]MCW0309939.1 hypothetical protein [Pantoea ananatis]MCW0341647.1 hypothetical protein [Pantoea ananatis]MCW0360079.1 hypothetical protein [Pantoea ananatis]MCW0364742.1 hypothetical protein [Pantoea ananatis]MCW1777394.1 hypothetical protein [Pantoea ananatis]
MLEISILSLIYAVISLFIENERVLNLAKGFILCFIGIGMLLFVGDFSTHSIISDGIKVILSDKNMMHVAFACLGLVFMFLGFVMFILFLFRKESSKS